MYEEFRRIWCGHFRIGARRVGFGTQAGPRMAGFRAGFDGVGAASPLPVGVDEWGGGVVRGRSGCGCRYGGTPPIGA